MRRPAARRPTSARNTGGSRRGTKKAEVALAHTILVIAYHVLTRKEPNQDLGPNYFDEHDRQAVERRLVRRLEKLGLKVTIEPAA